jgi:hypothetical protein
MGHGHAVEESLLQQRRTVDVAVVEVHLNEPGQLGSSAVKAGRGQGRPGEGRVTDADRVSDRPVSFLKELLAIRRAVAHAQRREQALPQALFERQTGDHLQNVARQINARIAVSAGFADGKPQPGSV